MTEPVEKAIVVRFDGATCIHKLFEYLALVQNNIPLVFTKTGISIQQGNDYVPQRRDLKSKKKLHDVAILNVATIFADDLSEYYYDESNGESVSVMLDGGRLIDSMPAVKTKNYLTLYILKGDSRVRYSINGTGENIVQPLVGVDNDAPAEYDFSGTKAVARICVEDFNVFTDAIRSDKGNPITIKVFQQGIIFSVKSYGHADARKFPFGRCDTLQFEFDVLSDFFGMLHNKVSKISDSRAVIKVAASTQEDGKRVLRLDVKIGSCGRLFIYVDERKED